MTDREDGTEIMMRPWEQSLKISKSFREASKYLYLFLTKLHH